MGFSDGTFSLVAVWGAWGGFDGFDRCVYAGDLVESGDFPEPLWVVEWGTGDVFCVCGEAGRSGGGH